MNVAPLHPAQRIAMIDKLGEGLSERAKDVMGFTLSDGHLRTCYEDLYGEIPKPISHRVTEAEEVRNNSLCGLGASVANQEEAA